MRRSNPWTTRSRRSEPWIAALPSVARDDEQTLLWMLSYKADAQYRGPMTSFSESADFELRAISYGRDLSAVYRAQDTNNITLFHVFHPVGFEGAKDA